MEFHGIFYQNRLCLRSLSKFTNRDATSLCRFCFKFIVFMTPLIRLCLHSTLWALGHRMFYAFLGASLMKWKIANWYLSEKEKLRKTLDIYNNNIAHHIVLKTKKKYKGIVAEWILWIFECDFLLPSLFFLSMHKAEKYFGFLLGFLFLDYRSENLFLFVIICCKINELIRGYSWYVSILNHQQGENQFSN